MPSIYPHAQFHTGEALHTWLTEHQRDDESLSQTARRLLIAQMNGTTPTDPTQLDDAIRHLIEAADSVRYTEGENWARQDLIAARKALAALVKGSGRAVDAQRATTPANATHETTGTDPRRRG